MLNGSHTSPKLGLDASVVEKKYVLDDDMPRLSRNVMNDKRKFSSVRKTTQSYRLELPFANKKSNEPDNYSTNSTSGKRKNVLTRHWSNAWKAEQRR